MIAIEEYTRQLLQDLHPVIVANRAPVDVQLEADEEYRFVRGGGGLVTGLAGLAQATGAVWVACAREGPDQELSASDGSEPLSLQTEEGLRYRVLWVKPPRLAYDLYYNTIANPLLWFVQHYLWNLAEAPMLDEIMDGLLASDVVGLQTRSDVRNFLLTCEENMGLPIDLRQQVAFYRGRTVWVRNYPISIDVREFEASARTPAVERAERDILRWRTRHVIFRVDRMDLSKNIVRGFLAYDRLLQVHPEWRGEVVFWALLQKTRQNVREYREYARQVQQAVRVVNERHGTPTWQPIRLEQRDDIPRAIAGYKQFDVLLVNAIYDGMNLVAKEGITVNRRGGVLVLSENAGAHEELGQWAITINPFDVDGTAEALHRALLMDGVERHARAEKMRGVVEQNDIARWISAQLQDLRDLVEPAAARRPELRQLR